ncbi:MAG TPA: choice-of-anchor Q domain-containing protein [Gemmatimonadales bacterium]|nr:choice-of-anchor Q domain-containing protein [Gemmatimonadales bacterium]
MHCPRFFPLPFLLPLLVLAACGEDQSTAPTLPGGATGAAFSTASLKVVNSLADPGNGICNASQCTLREAINDPASTAISFASGLTGPITLAKPTLGGGMLRIEKTLTITGPGTGIVIQRQSTDPAFRILRIGSGVNVKLANLTIRGGKTDRAGGGIINFGTLELTDCTVSDNSAEQGGGIDNHGPLTLLNSTIRHNSADFRGGGVANHSFDTVTVANTTFANNSAGLGQLGGGIWNLGGTLMLTNSLVASNTAGGIANTGTATVASTRIADNSNGGGGGIENTGRMTLSLSTVAHNTGAGILNRDGGTFTVSKSTIVGNSGGGIFNKAVATHRPATITLRNSTVSGNLVSSFGGGGIINAGSLATARVNLFNTTVTDNSALEGLGGGIRQQAGELALTNSIVAKNNAAGSPDVRIEGGSVLSRFSLIGEGEGSGITNTDGNQVGNVSPNTAPIDPKLGPLTLNGGPTPTHALLLGSPAIDAGSTADCPATDQRGVSRPQGAACDIGSYERK